MSHLGTWVSALADGQLSPAATERALAHVAACPPCAEELAAARQARRALAVTRDVTPDPELTARLLALAADGAPAPAPRREPHRSIVPLGESAYAVPAKARSGDLARRRSPARLLGGVLAGAGVVVASLFVLGDAAPVVPATHPAEALTVLSRAPQHAPVHRGVAERQLMATVATTGGVASRETADVSTGDGSTDAAVLAWMHAEGWSCPEDLPVGYRVTAVRVGGEDGEILEVDLAGPDGRVVLTEQRGRLDVASLGPVEERTIDGRTLYVLSRHPWHAVWQSDDTVVSIVSEAPQERARTVVERFPVAEYDDGLTARLARGWDTLTGALGTR